MAENFTLNNENIIEYLDEENLTETDKLSRDLLVDYLSMKKSGTLNENKSNLVEYLSQGAINSSADMMGKTYTYSDLNIVESNTKNEFDEYKTIFIKTMTFNNNPSQDFTIFKNALQSKDKLKLKELNTIISLYEGMLKNLLKMNVPSDLAQSHLIILNSFDDMIESTKIMSNIFEDPVAGLAGMSARISSEEVFLVGLNKLNDILEK
ncbi:MAG: hypothetical protein PHX25_03100 [Candidatus Pacebacteria bacterium]|nr:hypothetical protein [Candidatus Paceibacterota bacterium]